MFETDVEHSPSATGLHIITKGSLERGRKRAQIEVYSPLHTMTMTGNVYRDAAIIDEDVSVKRLWHDMGGAAEKAANSFNAPQAQANAAVVERMFKRESGEKAQALYNGSFAANYATQSEADFALLD